MKLIVGEKKRQEQVWREPRRDEVVELREGGSSKTSRKEPAVDGGGCTGEVGSWWFREREDERRNEQVRGAFSENTLGNEGRTHTKAKGKGAGKRQIAFLP